MIWKPPLGVAPRLERTGTPGQDLRHMGLRDNGVQGDPGGLRLPHRAVTHSGQNGSGHMPDIMGVVNINESQCSHSLLG